jgi:hypothetical protein
MYAERPETETRIARKLLQDALAAGYAVSVHDSEEWAISRSTDEAAIWDVMGETDVDSLRFRKGGDYAGFVTLIWGNDTDLISDHTDNDAMASLVAGAMALADSIAAERLR